MNYLEAHKDLISTVRVGQLPDKIKNSVNPLIKPNFCFHFSTPKFSSRVSGYPQFPRDSFHGFAAKIDEAPRPSSVPVTLQRCSQPSVVTPRAGVTSGQPSASLRGLAPRPSFFKPSPIVSSAVATVTNSDMAMILRLGRVANGTATFHRPVSDLISTEAYGIEKVRVPRLNPGPLIQEASVGNEVVEWK